MSGYTTVPAGYGGDLVVAEGPRLLRGVLAGPELTSHRTFWGAPRPLEASDLVSRTDRAGLRGRGGAGFPFHRKLATALASGRKRTVIVNASEGEPGSAKDSSLLITAPHLVLDGAELVASALETSTVVVTVPGERPAVRAALERAISERSGDIGWDVQETGGTFVGGQARAVIELTEGRENLPVTSWAPESVSGVKGRPTLLSNAETFAQVAVVCALGVSEYVREGIPGEPGTTLLTVAGDSPGGVVLEVPFGIPLPTVLAHCGYETDGPLLMGGYHGAWLPADEVLRRTVSRGDLAGCGASIGAGVILPLDPMSCPVLVTARIVDYLAAHSARRCGPCRNGLPALGTAMNDLGAGGGTVASARAKELVALVTGRGACAHPDGTARLVRSLFRAFPDEVRAHEHGGCLVMPGADTELVPAGTVAW
jgi:NADH:ubiquinone oxidoreductase subunit F (NADH-binding)